MCGRCSMHACPEALATAFGVPAPTLPRRYDSAPSEPVAIVRAEGGKRNLAMALWGLIPSWSQRSDAAPNARAEAVATKPWFRDAFQRTRCLVPADGFYEWKA